MVSWLVIAAALGVFPVLFFVPAPYGRHLRQGFAPVMPARLAWVVMESPSVFVFAWCFWTQSPLTRLKASAIATVRRGWPLPPLFISSGKTKVRWRQWKSQSPASSCAEGWS